MSLRRVAVSLALAVVMLTGTAASAQEQPAQVRVDAVRVEPLSQTVPILGRLVADQRGEVAARVSGAVQQLDVRVGDRVEAGDRLALVDEARLAARAQLAEARVVAAQAQIETAEAELSLLEQERARLAQLRNSAAFSPAALEDKVQELQAATARIARARAQFDEALADQTLAERDLADAEVLAPYPGVITSRYVSAGDHLDIGEPVVALINDTSLEIEADVPSAQARVLQAGIELDVTLDGRASSKATLRALIPDENPLTRTLAIRLSLGEATEDLFLASGQSVTVDVPLGAVSEALTVDKDAVLRRGEGAMVFVAADGEAQLRPVTLGEAVGARFEVMEGLTEGELVIVRGNERLRPGQAISYEPPQSTASPVVSGSAS